MSTQQSVTDAVRVAMALRNMSQADLGRVLGLSQPAVSHRLRGAIEWTTGELDKLARYFGITVADLVSDRQIFGAPLPPPPVVEVEPERRGTVVLDQHGDAWRRDRMGRWTCLAPVDGVRRTKVEHLVWTELVTRYGPVTQGLPS